jgi:hypothetical protein
MGPPGEAMAQHGFGQLSDSGSSGHRLRAAVLGLVLLLVPGTAHGQAADVLFEQGKQLLEEGKYDEACELLKKSDELDPAVGTKFHLADCYVKAGKTATGWKLFMEVASISKTVGYEEGEKAALERARQLEGDLSRLTIQVTAGQSRVSVTLDGRPVEARELGKPMPVDPGEYTVEATAPRKEAFSTTVRVAGPADAQTVVVPVLEDLAEGAASPASASVQPDRGTAQPQDDGSTQRLAGYIVGGVGIVGLGVGTIFGLSAISKWNERNEHCPGGRCDATAVQLADETNTAAMISNIGFGLGVVGLGVGGYLVFTAPSGTGDAAAAQPGMVASAVVDSTGASVTVRGDW